MQFFVEDYAFEQQFDAFGVQVEHRAFVVEYRGFLGHYVLLQKFFGVDGIVRETAVPVGASAHHGIAAQFEDGFAEQFVVVHFALGNAYQRFGKFLVALGYVVLKTVRGDCRQFSRRTSVIGHKQFAVREVFHGFDLGIWHFATIISGFHLRLLSFFVNI